MKRVRWSGGIWKIAVIFSIISGFSATAFADGLPGEYLLTQRWRELLSVHSPQSNPAFMTEENYVSFRGAFAPVLHAEFLFWETGLTIPIGLYQSAGFTWIGQSDGDVPGYRVNNDGRIIAGDELGSNSNSYFMLSYAYNLWRRLSIGVNLALAYQSNFGDPLYGMGADIGLTYRLLRHALIGDHIVGVSTINLLAPAMGSGVFASFGDDEGYSRGIRCSWAGRFWERRLEGGLDFDLKDIAVSSDAFVDLDKEIEWGLSLRLGAWILQVLQFNVSLGFDPAGIEYWGLAGGVNVPGVNNGRDFSVLYQYQMKTESSQSSAHTLYVRADFGKHREEIHARRLARLLSISPNKLYNKALALYHAGKYWEAFFVFGQIEALFPDFFKMDWVSYYMGSCQEELDMRVSALERYTAVKSRYPNSPVVPYSDLGIMRLNYRDREFGGVFNQYIEISKPNVSDSLKYHGYYLMGEALMRKDRFREALVPLTKIPENHPDFVFARHSAGVASFIEDDVDGALKHLESCVLAQTKTVQQREMISRSCLLMGFYFYEQHSLAKAVTALRMVPATSYYYEDALLGLGWTAILAGQWSDCAKAGNELQRVSGKEILKAEGMMLEAYALMRDKQFIAAVQILENAAETARRAESPSQDSLSLRHERYRKDRILYNSLAQEMNRQSGAEQAGTVNPVLDSMQAAQKNMRIALNAFPKYEDEFERRTFFSRSRDKIMTDIDYLLAIARRNMTGEKAMKVERKMIDKQKTIDDEIKKLEEEMEQLAPEQ